VVTFQNFLISCLYIIPPLKCFNLVARHPCEVADPRVEHAGLGLARVHGARHVIQLHALTAHGRVRAPVQENFGVQLRCFLGGLAVPEHLREAVLDCGHGFSGATLVDFQLRYCGIELRDLKSGCRRI